MGVGGKFGVMNKDKGGPQGNLGGTGVFNFDVEGYIRSIMHLSQNYRRKRQKSSLLQEISYVPTTMHFDPDHTPIHQAHRNGNLTKSWDLEDVDFSPQRRGRLATDSDRSLTPEPQIERLYSTPEPVKKGRRRFTISNIIHKAKSPHINRKKRYKVVSTSEIFSSPVRGHSPLLIERETPEMVGRLNLPEDGEDVVDSGTGEDGGAGEGEREGGKEKDGEGKREKSIDDTNSEKDSLDQNTLLHLEQLKALSPTRGIPKTYSLKRTGSYSGRSDLERGRDEIDIDDVIMTEGRETFVTPEPIGRKNTIDWEAMDEMVDQEDTRETSRPSTSTPDLPTSPRGGGLWASPKKQTTGHVSSFTANQDTHGKVS